MRSAFQRIFASLFVCFSIHCFGDINDDYPCESNIHVVTISSSGDIGRAFDIAARALSVFKVTSIMSFVGLIPEGRRFITMRYKHNASVRFPNPMATKKEVLDELNSLSGVYVYCKLEGTDPA